MLPKKGNDWSHRFLTILQPVSTASKRLSVEVHTFRAGAWSAAGQAGELPPHRAASRREVQGEEVVVAAARGPHPRAAKEQDLLPMRNHPASRQTAVQRSHVTPAQIQLQRPSEAELHEQVRRPGI